MNTTTDSARPAQPSFPRRRLLLLAGTFFMLGAILAGVWFHRQNSSRGTGELAAPTKSLLEQLAAPATIHYYALLPGNTDAALQAFAGRVADLLDAMQTASGGKLSVNRWYYRQRMEGVLSRTQHLGAQLCG